MTFCQNEAFNYQGTDISFITIIVLHSITAFGIVFLMCRLCTKAFSYSNYHIYQSYKLYIITLFATVLIVAARMTQYTVKQLKQLPDTDQSKQGWIIFNQIMGTCSILAMNQAYTQNGFTWIMIYLGYNFSGLGENSINNQPLNRNSNRRQIQENQSSHSQQEDSIKKRMIVKRAKNIIMYGIMPILSLLALIMLLFQNQWCNASEILIVISTIFSLITIITPLILLLKNHYNDPLLPKSTKYCWIFIVVAVFCRQIFLLILLLSTLISDESHGPSFLASDPLGILYALIFSICPVLCMIYLAEEQLHKQKSSSSPFFNRSFKGQLSNGLRKCVDVKMTKVQTYHSLIKNISSINSNLSIFKSPDIINISTKAIKSQMQKTMNEQVKKIIKSSFCPKEKWITDDDAKNCFKCDKKFHPLFRRKHHCRSCGQVFCSECSDFFISGSDLGQAEKNVRMCQICYQKCWKYIVKHDEAYTQFRKSKDSKQDSIPENIQQLELQKSQGMNQKDRLKQIQSIIQQYSTEDEASIKHLKDTVYKKFKIILQVLLKQGGVPLKYLPKIQQICRSIHQKIPPNAMITEHMSISTQLRIKCFHRDCDDVSFQLCQGVLMKKLFKSKKVKQQYENISCVLVYGGIQAEDLLFEKEVSFESMVQNRLKQMNNLIRSCENLKINIIFCQGGVEKQFEDMLKQKGITVISRVKVDTLSKIKSALGILVILQSISKLYQHNSQEVVGHIAKMTSMSEIAIKQGNQTKKFFYIPSKAPELGLTLFIRGNSHQILLKLKKLLQESLQLMRHMNLKVYKVLLDHQLLDSMSETKKNQCYLNNSEIFFNLYSQHHSDVLNYLKQTYLTYKHITYVQSNFMNFPEVTKEGLEEYLAGRTHSFLNKWDFFSEICGCIKDKHQRYYSDQDIPMGAFILKKINGLNQKCVQCGKPNYTHIEMFYSTDQYVQMWTESRIVQCFQQQEQVKPVESPSDLVMVFDNLQKQKKNKLSCHIECRDCQQMISAKKFLSKQHLEFSFLAFMNHMFKGSVETKIRQTIRKKNKKNNANSTCHHHKKTRVFELGDRNLKIFVGKYTINRQCLMTKSGKQAFLKKKSEKFTTEKCLLQTHKIERIGFFMLDQIKNIAEGSKMSNFQSMLKNPKSSFMKVRSSLIGNVKLSQAQCVDMILPEVIDELSKLNNIAVILLNHKRVKDYLHASKIVHAFVGLLKRMYTIVVQIKKSVKKRDLDKKFNASDFDDECFMEQIDINSVLQASSQQSCDQTQQTRSQISRGDNYSTATKDDYKIMQNQNEYQWLRPQEQRIIPNRFDRKTQYNFNPRKTNKATQEETIRFFKQFSSILRVQHAIYDYIPAYPNQSQLLIASALNSQIHKQCIQSSNQFKHQLKVPINSFLETDIHLEYQELNKISAMIAVHQRRFSIEDKLKKSPTINYQISLLYPNQFEILRRKKQIPLELFINSIGGAESWITSGGKSGCTFMRSYNDLFVIKRINQREFMTFVKMVKNYFTHLHNGSLLAPIYGAFVVTRNNTQEYFIVMENLFFGMKDWYLYDFKGSVTKRFSKPPTIPLDVNMLIDRNSQPIFCKQNVLKNLTSTLNFLVESNVVDYSLILVVQIEDNQDYYLDGNRFQIGIVDYMREFGAGEYVERLWKGSEGTVQQPIHYRERMEKKLKDYFTQIPI